MAKLAQNSDAICFFAPWYLETHKKAPTDHSRLLMTHTTLDGLLRFPRSIIPRQKSNCKIVNTSWILVVTLNFNWLLETFSGCGLHLSWSMVSSYVSPSYSGQCWSGSQKWEWYMPFTPMPSTMSSPPWASRACLWALTWHPVSKRTHRLTYHQNLAQPWIH